MTSAFKGERPALFDLSGRAKLRLTGADVFRFLNGQITNDIRKTTSSSAIQGSILTAKGKLSAHVFVLRDNKDGFLIDADPKLREDLVARLERYIIADDVQIEDVTESISLFHCLVKSAPTLGDGVSVAFAERFGLPGWDFWYEGSLETDPRAALSNQFDFCDDHCAEVFRIERGIPRWGKEL